MKLRALSLAIAVPIVVGYPVATASASTVTAWSVDQSVDQDRASALVIQRACSSPGGRVTLTGTAPGKGKVMIWTHEAGSDMWREVTSVQPDRHGRWRVRLTTTRVMEFAARQDWTTSKSVRAGGLL